MVLANPNQPRKQPALIVAGPTASGKSALAMRLAERLNGAVINADAMQVYRELRIITARPGAADEARVPHALYGNRPAAEAGNVACWREAALVEMARAQASGRLPILTGGTGLYLAALTEGLSAIPDPGPAARAEARGLLAEAGPIALHARLVGADPATAALLRPTDSQRIARAWEIWRGTGRGLAAWQQAERPPVPWRFAAITLDPPRAALRAAIAARVAAMLQAGAVDEVRGLLAMDLDPVLPAMRALGVAELAAHLRGEVTLEHAARRIALVTGQLAKRQATWFRHHVLAAPARTHTIHAQFTGFEQLSERNYSDLLSFIETLG